MIGVEKLSEDLYETLLELRYPGLATAASKNIVETILAPENRLSLLTWLLMQSSLSDSQVLSSKAERSEIIKLYMDMGISDNPDVLMGAVPLQDQIAALNNLLSLMRNGLRGDRSRENSTHRSGIIDLSKKCTSDGVNIMPSTWGLSKILTRNEASEYLNRCRNSLESKDLSSLKSHDEIKSDSLSNEAFRSVRKSECSVVSDAKACVKKFIEAFESASTWPKSRSSESASICTKSMDNCIDNLSRNMTMLKETFRSKEEILNSAPTERLKRRDMPLDGPIEDIVIAIEEASRLQIGE